MDINTSYYNTESPTTEITDNRNMVVDNSLTPAEQVSLLPPSKCVIYIVINDILEEGLPVTVFDNLGSLISDLKENNNIKEIYVCQVIPMPTTQEIQIKVEDYIELLVKWGETNDVEVIETVPTFRLGTGELHDLSFHKEKDVNSGFTLNSLGAIKVLSTIKIQCPGFHLFFKCNEVKNSWNKQCTKR